MRESHIPAPGLFLGRMTWFLGDARSRCAPPTLLSFPRPDYAAASFAFAAAYPCILPARRRRCILSYAAASPLTTVLLSYYDGDDLG